jgi:putative effector of murein hydrolase LrgA (UPF0299 family)
VATEPLPWWAKLASSGYLLLFVLLYGAVFAGLAFAWREAAYVALGAFVATLVVHVTVAIVNYRRVMRREWPKVEPIVEDDDWDAA